MKSLVLGMLCTVVASMNLSVASASTQAAADAAKATALGVRAQAITEKGNAEDAKTAADAALAPLANKAAATIQAMLAAGKTAEEVESFMNSYYSIKGIADGHYGEGSSNFSNGGSNVSWGDYDLDFEFAISYALGLWSMAVADAEGALANFQTAKEYYETAENEWQDAKFWYDTASSYLDAWNA